MERQASRSESILEGKTNENAIKTDGKKNAVHLVCR